MSFCSLYGEAAVAAANAFKVNSIVFEQASPF